MSKTSLLEEYCRILIKGSSLDEQVTLSLEEFEQLYYILMGHANQKAPVVALVNLSDQAFVTFPEYSRQEFIVSHSQPITEQLFRFLSNLHWYGPKQKPKTFSQFLKAEAKISWKRFLLALLASALLLILSGTKVHIYELLSSLLIQSSTVFLTIYLIFTVAQTDKLSKDRKLFELGILSDYYSDDRNITVLGIITVALVLINTIVVELLLQVPNQYPEIFSQTIRLTPAFTTGFVIAMLFHMFYTVATYYLERTRDVVERDTVKDILNEEDEHFAKASDGASRR